MKSIGFDEKGDEHVIPDEDDPEIHRPEVLCGCNPDPYHDENPWNFDAPPRPVKYWWSHHHLSYED
jgi:hypothetical protein